MRGAPRRAHRDSRPGQIVGRRDAGLHIRFTALAHDDELAIARYIDEVVIGWE